MPYDFISDNPAISQFNARVAVGDQQRGQEEADFANRYGIEREIGADKALRRIAPMYPFQQQTQVPVQTPTLAAPVTPVPATAAPSVVPTENPDYGGVPPRAAPAPNVAPAPPAPAAAPGQAPAISSFTAAQPAGVAAPQPQPQAQPQQQSPYGPMVSELVKTPGTGAYAMQLVGQDRAAQHASAIEQRKERFEAEKLVWQHIKSGDIRIAKTISDQYRLNIPAEVFNDRRISTAMQVGARTSEHSIGKDASPEQHMTYMLKFAETYMQTGDEGAATAAALKAALEVKSTNFNVAGHITDPQDRTVFYDKHGRLMQTDQKVRPPQPPFSITPTGISQHDQQLRDKAIDNAMKEAGHKWGRMSPDEKQQRIDAHFEYLKSGKASGGMPGPARPGGAAPAAAPGASSIPKYDPATGTWSDQ